MNHEVTVSDYGDHWHSNYKSVRKFIYIRFLDKRNLFDVRFEVFTAVTMKNEVFWSVTPRGSHVVPSSPILVTLMKEALSFSETSVTRGTRRNTPKKPILRNLFDLNLSFPRHEIVLLVEGGIQEHFCVTACRGT
jgi:hypothetical protein